MVTVTAHHPTCKALSFWFETLRFRNITFYLKYQNVSNEDEKTIFFTTCTINRIIMLTG